MTLKKNSFRLFVAVAILLLISNNYLINAQPSITSISTPQYSGTIAQGSTEGGTLVVVKGSGFSTLAAQNKFSIGPYPCIILAEGTRQDGFTCRTTKATDPTKQTYLPVQIQVSGFPKVNCTSNPCRFSYNYWFTPLIEQISPRTAVGDQQIAIWGSHRITDPGDQRSNGAGQIYNILIDDKVCSTLDVTQEDQITPGWRDYIRCKVFKDQQAGQYFVTQHVHPGFAKFQIRTVQTSLFTGNNYTQRVAGKISSMPYHQGGNQGHQIQLKGNGFSKKVDNYECKIAGQDCKIKDPKTTSITVVVPPLDAGNSNFGALPKDAAHSSDPNEYLGSNGFRYTRYERDQYRISSQWFTFLRGSHNLVVEANQIRTQLRSSELISTPYVEYWRGYFYAPIAGQYRFAGMADDGFGVQISSQPNTRDQTLLQDLIFSNQYSPQKFNPYYLGSTSNIANVTLSQGHYYMEIVSYNQGGPGDFRVLVDTPQLNTTTANPTWQVDQITIEPQSVQPQIVQIKITKTAIGVKTQWNIQQWAKTVEGTLNIQSCSIKWRANATQFADQIKKLQFYDYSPIVTLTTKDIAGVQTSVTADIQSYTYRLTYNRLRRSSLDLSKQFYSTTATFARIQNHSAPISGTYKLQVDGLDLKFWSSTNNSFSLVNVPFDTKAGDIQTALNNQYSTDKIKVRQMKKNSYNQTSMFVIEYIGILEAPRTLTVVTTGLKGGLDNITIGTVVTKRYFNIQRSLYSPVPFEFLRTAQSQPQLHIKINGIPVVCSDCSYNFVASNTAVATSASLATDTLTVALTNPGSVNFALQDIKILFHGVRCNQITGSTTILTCKFPANSAGNAALPAGSTKPVIHIAQIGYVDTSSVTNISIPLVVSTVTPAEVGINGGIQATITGFGFPVDKNTDFSLNICGNIVTKVTSVTNEEIKFIVPQGLIPCSRRRLLQSAGQLFLNGVSANIGMRLVTGISPIISSLSKTSSSPILKSSLIITGQKFTTIAKTKVHLTSSDDLIKYQLTIVSMNSTSIQCILGGGKTGAYNVTVIDADTGISQVDANTVFNYEIIVDSISPVSGSLGGGYDITITGRNFASADSHTVFIGEAQNNICTVKSATATQIVCTMPRINSQYTAGTLYQVIVTGRLLEQSICKGSCGFTYDNSVTNNVTVPTQLIYNIGDSVTVAGSDLTGATVTVGGKTATITASSASSLTFTYPSVKYGTYEVLIRTPTGFAHPKIQTTTKFSMVSGLSRSSGSLNGHRISVAGNGYPQSVDRFLSVNLICLNYTVALPIVSVVPTKLTFQTVPSLVDQACKLNVSYEATFINFMYTYKTTQTAASTIVAGAGLSYTITTISDVEFASFQYLSSQNSPTTTIYPATVTKVNSTTYNIVPTGGYLPNGKFRILVHSFYTGYHTVTPTTFTRSWSSNPTFTAITSSFVGGKQLTLSGSGFWTNSIQNNEIFVCGLKAKTKSATNTSLVLQAPAFVTSVTQGLYQLAKPTSISGVLISDTPQKAPNVVDDKPSTFYTSDNAACFVGFNFGQNARANIESIKYMPNPAWPIAATYLQGAKFQGSNDNVAWTDIFIIDTKQVHTGWNFWMKPAGPDIQYQYVRFTHTNVSKCQISDIQISGIIYSTIPVTAGVSKSCDVVIKGPTDITLTNAITFSHSSTSTITGVSPKFGPSVGNTAITITGTNFGTNLNVVIDGVNCPISFQNATQIICTTGRRNSIPTTNSFVITSDGNPVLVTGSPYLYIDRWSNQDTWGGQAIPRKGDSVYVPKGMSLLVDVQSTPVLDAIIVQGKIIFSDEKDMTLDTHYFIINGGQFTAGTQTNRYNHKLTITLHGGYYDKQLPTFGNKVLGCRNCKFNLHGQVRIPTWTQLSTTVSAGATSFTVLQPVDWKAGQEIVVASSSFDHYQSQKRTILSVSADNRTITVTQPFKYRHYSAVQDYDGVSFPMRAQVALLTRNIKVQGDELTSQSEQYGSHMMMNGKKSSGLVASFSYAEFTRCGQPRIIGRYCTHFHMTGQMPDSSVVGIAVHQSYARVLTIHATHYLLVEKNVGYHVKGHNIFIEDGIETNNVIQDNLMITSIVSLTLLQSDTSVASYWITNPYNTVRRNHAAGSDFYGFWYQIKEHPDGPSATMDVCPQGMPLGESRDNVAHSNVRFGLRIFKLSARKYPCTTTHSQGLIDPYEGNVAIESVFDNYTLWSNNQCGFLGQQLGYTTIKNFKVADSKKGGMQFHKTNYTKQQVVAQNCLIVGFSKGNAPANIDQYYNKARGFIASRTDGLRATGITFHNFGPTMTPLQSCSECYHFKLWVVGSKTTKFQNITYKNITGNYIFWQKWRRQVFMDLDGTLLKPLTDTLSLPPQTKGSITPFRHSVTIPGKCFQISGPSWDNSTYCDQTITLRSILFTNAIPKIDFNAINIKAKLLEDPYENFTLTNPPEANFSQQYMIIIKKQSKDIQKSWAMPFVVGQYYNIHWKWGIDFTHVAIAPSRLWQANEATILRFNYTDERELFEIGKWYKAQLQLPFLVKKANFTDLQFSTCQNGDYFHDKESRYLFVCVSGRNKTIRQWIDVNGIRCLNFCPLDQPDGTRQDFQRQWTNATQWPGGVLPKAGQNVTIPYEWNLILNLDQPSPIFYYVQVNGVLIFDASKNHNFQAKYIWVKKGIMRIGSEDRPYTNQAKITLHGQKDDRYVVLDPDASGNKMLAVTGQLKFYGQVTDNVWAKLTSIAQKNANTITVSNTNGWAVGNKLVIAPTYSNTTEDQQVQITEIDGNKVTFTPPLKYEHYGAAAPIVNSYGTIDTRGGVGLLTRNIQILKGPDANGWGCRVLVYSLIDPNEVDPTKPITRTGKITFDGVQIKQCSQYDTTLAALRLQNLGQFQDNTNKPNIITRSSIHSSQGMGVYMTKIKNVKFDNNVLYGARKFVVYVEHTNNYTFTNNLLVAARKRSELTEMIKLTKMADDNACYEQYAPIDFYNDNVTVTKNLAQGAEQGQGFVFPFAPCDRLDKYNFGGNTAGSCQVAFMFDRLQGYDCIGASYLVGYTSLIGLMANPSTQLNKMIYDNVIFVDNQRGITLRFAHDIDDNSMIVQNSYFAGFSRPDCPSCYADDKISYCKGGYAVRMFTSTITGQSFPLVKRNIGFDVICTRQSYDMKSFFNNVTFENYLYTNPTVPYCTQMSVFQRHNLASDATGSAYLTNTPCVNCQPSSWGYFDKPNAGLRGWFGGCGQMDCTGPNNYIIYDQDGKFTGSISQILANNSDIGQGQSSCTFNNNTNGYHCLTDELAVLQYESIAPDFNLRMVWPVLLKYDTGNWISRTNGWKEWQWNGPQPMNRRLARFVSVVKLHQNYNLTYASQPPSDSRFQIQKRLLPTGNASDWVIIRIYYPLPNSLQVLVKNATGSDILVKPFPLTNGIGKDLRQYTNVCGANNFHYQNGTIQFVVNGKDNCQVRVRLSSFVKISARLSIPVLDFFNNNGVTSFITNICAFLGIDTGRLKIVGVRNGSAIVDGYLISDPSAPANTPAAATQAQLTNLSNAVSAGLSSGDINVNAPVISVSTQLVIINPDGTIYDPNANKQKDNKMMMIIILATVIPALIIIISVAGYCYLKRKRERVSAVSSESQFSLQDSDKKLHNNKNYKREMIKVSQVPFQISKMSDSFTKC